MPVDPNTGQWLSPWEVAHGGEEYDPEREYERNDFDRATEEYYGRSTPAAQAEHSQTNWYDPGSYNWLINEPTPPGSNPPPPTPPPPPPVPPRPGGGGRPFSIAGGKQFFDYPDWVPPSINWGAWTPPSWDVQPFTHPAFEGPTRETFQADPGYEFRQDEMDRAIRNARSPTGLLATGGTLTELMRMRGGLASQEFGNVWNRQHQAYQTNRANAADIWSKGYMGEADEYTRGLTDYLTQEESKSRQWDRSRDLYTTNLGSRMGQFGLNLDVDRLGLARDNSQFGNLLSLATLMMQGRPTFTPTV